MKKSIYWILAGAAAIYLLAKKSLASKLQFSFKSFSTSGSITKPKLNIQLSALNPSNQSAKINSIVGELYVNSQFIGDVSSFTPQVILPNAESTVSFQITPSLLSAFSVVKGLIFNKGKGYKFEFKGNANVDGLVIPIAENYSL